MAAAGSSAARACLTATAAGASSAGASGSWVRGRQQSTGARRDARSTTTAQKKAHWSRSRKVGSQPAAAEGRAKKRLEDVGRSVVLTLAAFSPWRGAQSPAFVDSLEIHAEGGAGGDGCIAFAREKFQPYGPPAGGGGGQGGGVFIRAREGIASLARLPGRAAGGRGANGVGDWQPGKAGPDRIIDVPVGTIVRVKCLAAGQGSGSSELDERQSAYHDSLAQKYRAAYLRERRNKRSALPASLFRRRSEEDVDEEHDPLELRAQREASWRHYPGAVLPADAPAQETDNAAAAAEDDGDELEERAADNAIGIAPGENFDDQANSAPEEEPEELDPERAEAESDIRVLGRSFRESEKRFAFWLIDQRVREKAQRAAQMAKWKAQEQVEKGDDEHNDREPADAAEEAEASWSVDLDTATEDALLIVPGGHGGLGNGYFASAHNRSPTSATRGRAGHRAVLQLEWKYKGDIGLIGLPNAGKSTFLKAACAAGDSVRVAGYAFTTLQPNVGIVRIGDRGGLLGTGTNDVIESVSAPHIVDGSRADILGTGDASSGSSKPADKWQLPEDEVFRFTLQDLPGLVEGASDNRGLGHDFLKHIERCTALYYVVDVSGEQEVHEGGRADATPWVDMELVHDELEGYRAGLSAKVCGVLANKCDVLEDSPSGHEVLQTLRAEASKLHGRSIPVYNVSARRRLGVDAAVHAMARVVDEARRTEAEEKGKARAPAGR